MRTPCAQEKIGSDWPSQGQSVERAIDIHVRVEPTNASHLYLRHMISGSLYPDDLAL